MANGFGKKPMSLENEFALKDENTANDTIDNLINMDDLQNTQDVALTKKRLEDKLKDPEFLEMLKSLIAKGTNNLIKGVGDVLRAPIDTPQRLNMAGEQMEEGFKEYGGIGQTAPAFARGVKESMFGEPDPVEFGGKAQIYDEILNKGREYQMGGTINKTEPNVTAKAIRRLMTHLPIKFK